MADYRKLWGLLVIVMIGLSACQGGGQQATSTPVQPPSPTVDELSTLIAMQEVATEVPTATPWPTATLTYTPSSTPTITPTLTPTLTPTDMPDTATPLPTNTPRPTLTPSPDLSDPANITDHYWFERPFPRDPSNGIRDYLSRSYPYGSTGGGQLQVHHGVDIQNGAGTAILAVADGWVIYAGTDKEMQFGPRNDFYGNLVIIEHDFPAPNGLPLYTLYGHMMRVDVETGQYVQQGEKIGQVGSTGVALGAHLHLEVRLGDAYDYSSTVNPDLWLRPWPEFGTLAGRITDVDGNRLYDTTITLLSDDGPSRYTFSYADDNVNPDPYRGEHFTYGDLPAGEYTVLVRMRDVKRFEGEVTIEAGRTSWIDIQLR